MIDFTVSQTAMAVHPIIKKIEQQCQSLQNLVHFNQGYFIQENKRLEEWKKAEDERVYNKYADELQEMIENEENKVELQYDWEKEILWHMENDFYHSTFILAYSYFESLVAAMCKEKAIRSNNHIDNKVSNILQHCKTQFTADTQTKYNYVTGDLKEVRNLLTHNYNGTDKQEQLAAADREHAKNIGFEKKSDEFFVIKLQYIEHVINNVYPILKELSAMLNL